MLATRIGGLVLALATSVVIARQLGPDGRGTVAVAFSLTLLLMQLGTLGLSTANPYFTATEPTSRNQIVANTIWLTLTLGTLLVGLGVTLTSLFPAVTGDVGWPEIGIALAGLPFGLGAQFLQSILLGEGRTRAYNVAEFALALATFIAVLVVTGWLDAGPRTTLGVLVVARVAAWATFLAVVARGGFSWRADRNLARRMLRYGAKVYLATFLSFLLIRVDLLLVNGYLGTEQAGYYSVAVALADAMYVLPAAVAVNLFAHVSRGLEAEATAAVFRSLAVLYAGICAVSALLVGPVIGVLYGSAFEPAIALYLWLAPGIFCLGMLNVLAQHFAGVGFPIEAALVWFAGLGLNLALNLLFLREGAYVASIASSVAYALLLVLHVGMFARQIGGYNQLRPRPVEAWSVMLRLVRQVRTR